MKLLILNSVSVIASIFGGIYAEVVFAESANDLPEPARGRTQHFVVVYQHEALATRITNAQVDQILNKMTSMFSTNTPSCNVEFTRKGNVGSFSQEELPFSINSAGDFAKFKKVPPSIKIVGEINWCGGFGNGIIGCASTPGPAWTVVRYEPSMEYILWGHEFAHTTGSQHRDESGALMRPALYPEDVFVNHDECRRLVAGSSAVNTGIGAAGLDGPPSTTAQDSVPRAAVSDAGKQPELTGPPEPVTSFIRKGWIEGVPYNLAKLYSDDDIPALVQVLEDEKSSELWRAIVATLGAIGTPRARYALMNFLLKNPDGQLSPSQYIAKANVPVALGWIVQASLERSEGKDNDRNTLDTLIQMTNSDYWTEVAKINWVTPIHKTRESLIESLVVKGMVGCSLTGTEECKIRLTQIGKSTQPSGVTAPTASESAAVIQGLGASALPSVIDVSPGTKEVVRNRGGDSLISDMLGEHGQIRIKGGLKNYYSR